MHPLISKIFSKRGIKDAAELSPDEKMTFQAWESILGKDELTLSDIKEFCLTQINLIESKWADLNLEQGKKSEMIPYHTVYKAILRAIDSQKVAREALEKQLTELTK